MAEEEGRKKQKPLTFAGKYIIQILDNGHDA